MSIVGVIMRKVTAEMSSEGVMAGPLAGTGMVEVNPCVFSFTSHFPLQQLTHGYRDKIPPMAGGQRGSWPAASSDLVECIEDACQKQNLACATWMIPSPPRREAASHSNPNFNFFLSDGWHALHSTAVARGGERELVTGSGFVEQSGHGNKGQALRQ